MIRFLLALLLVFVSFPAFAQQDYLSTQNFAPRFGGGQTITATTSSVSATTFTGDDVTNRILYVFNSGNSTVYVRWGTGAQTATTADLPVPAGSVQVFNKGNANTVAAISASGTNAVLIITGSGR